MLHRTQIFDILKAPLADYAVNVGRLLAALEGVRASVAWRSGDALHDSLLDAHWVSGTSSLIQKLTVTNQLVRSPGDWEISLTGNPPSLGDQTHSQKLTKRSSGDALLYPHTEATYRTPSPGHPHLVFTRCLPPRTHLFGVCPTLLWPAQHQPWC